MWAPEQTTSSEGPRLTGIQACCTHRAETHVPESYGCSPSLDSCSRWVCSSKGVAIPGKARAVWPDGPMTDGRSVGWERMAYGREMRPWLGSGWKAQQWEEAASGVPRDPKARTPAGDAQSPASPSRETHCLPSSSCQPGCGILQL